MNKQEIMQLLPHRDSMLLIDEAEVVDGEAHGRKTITGDEWFLQGHFPGNPIPAPGGRAAAPPSASAEGGLAGALQFSPLRRRRDAASR